MRVEVFADAAAVAREAAGFIAARARDSVRARGRFLLALSGGSTPWLMLEALCELELPWSQTQVFQVDERVTGLDEQRNVTQIRELLLHSSRLAEERLHAMPVDSDDLESAARHYAQTLQAVAGSPPVLDLVHLGLGDDGHTASLVPGDAVLDVTTSEVSLSGEYRGHRRMTLTYPVIDSARQVLWLVTGAGKAAMLRRLREADAGIPAGRVSQGRAVVFADEAAAGR